MSTIAAATAVRVTAREIETVKAIARGLTNDEIAHEQGIATRTVKYRIEQLKYKLRVRGSTARRRLPQALLEQTGIDPYPRMAEEVAS